MSNLELSFLTTLIASFSTLIGFIPVLFNVKNTKTIINSSLSIASGVMISVSLTSLLPESIDLLSIYNSSITTIIIVFFFSILGIITIKTIFVIFLPSSEILLIHNCFFQIIILLYFSLGFLIWNKIVKSFQF